MNGVEHYSRFQSKGSRLVTHAALAFCASLLLSCSTTSRMAAKWEENAIDGPWVAPGIRARELTRSYFAGLMHTSDATDTVWTTANGSHRDARGIVDSVENQLKKLGYFDRWPESQSSVGGYRQRLAPFTFHIVAIEPTVVLMVPHDFGNPKGNRSITDIVGLPPKQSWGSTFMINHIEYGTTVPYHGEVLWCSPDLGIAPTPLKSRSNSEMELVHKRIKLTAEKADERLVTRREAP